MLVYCHIKNVKKRCYKHQILIRLQSLRTNINKFFCVVLLYVFTFWVLFCDVRYDFRIKTMFGLSLPVVCRRERVLFMLFVFACVWWCPTHIVLCFCFIFLRLVHLMLPVYLDCPFLSLMFIDINSICMKKKKPHKSNKTPAIIWKLHKNNFSIYMYIFTYWY